MIAVTMGDANGVGPEIILKAFSEGKLGKDTVIVGDLSAFLHYAGLFGVQNSIHGITESASPVPNKLNVLDLKLLSPQDIQPGTLSEKTGAASREYIVQAHRLAEQGIVSAICTLPVNKEAIRLSDSGFTGHTELLAELSGQTDYTMMLISDKLAVTHVSTHVSMREAIERVTKERVKKVIALTWDAVCRYKENPRIAVSGLNAHAGENGSFGQEEIRYISPAVREFPESMHVSGPYPPDSVFLRATRGEFDAVVCMYHDQGHIPMKMLDFFNAVNVTLGLSVIRTSVDHGTAFDIAGTGKADIRSFLAAYRMAQKLSQ